MSQVLKKVHFIAIGGSVMSNLAVALLKNGIDVSGSDDEIYDPAHALLAAHDLLPNKQGWNADNIKGDIDAIILGMHAKSDNPELIKAQELGIPVYSYPEFITMHAENKQRIVICGSHGKTTITSMIVHVLRFLGREVDYMVGAKIEGIEETIHLSEAPVMVVEGDEYLSSPIDRAPKFLKYNHHIALISGIAWDHINVYPTIDSYVEQFEILADSTPKAGSLIFFDQDHMTSVICNKEREDVKILPYNEHPYNVREGRFYLKAPSGQVPVHVFGKHNMQNIAGAKMVLSRIGVTEDSFYEAIREFKGSYKRNSLIAKNDSTSIYEDYAHSPSKLNATIDGLKELYPDRRLFACYELHTFSSLNKAFLREYAGKLQSADIAVVFLNDENLSKKGYPSISDDEIKNAFERNDIHIFHKIEQLKAYIKEQQWNNSNLIFMSSGNFNGMDIHQLANTITGQ